MDILLALGSALATAVYFVYVSQTMKRQAGLSSSFTLAVSHLAAAAALFPLWLALPHEAFPAPLWPALLLAAGLLLVSRELYFYAYAHTDIAHVTVFSALTPVYAVGTGYIFLHETPSPLQLTGLLLICGSIYALFLKRPANASWIKAVAQPFRHIGTSAPILCAFLSTIPTAFAAVSQKYALQTLDPLSFSFFLLLLIGGAALGISCIISTPQGCVSQWRRLPPHFLPVSAIMLPVMNLLFCLVMQHQYTAVSLVLQRSSSMFQILLAYTYLRERRDGYKRVTVAALVMAGFAMILVK